MEHCLIQGLVILGNDTKGSDPFEQEGYHTGHSGIDEDECCQIKNVLGSKNPKMNGVYRLIGRSWNIPHDCRSPCIYTKINIDDNG